MFSNEDIVAIRVNNVCRKGDSFVFLSAYMPAKEPAPSNLLRDLLVFTEKEQIPTMVGTDANAHHTIWGSSDINPRGKDLLAYCASADLNFCTVVKRNGEFTKSPLQTLNYLRDILSQGSQQIENHAIRSDLVNNPFMRPKDNDCKHMFI